jgi:hypothetical protein
VRTDLEVIPKGDTDRNYADKWLENHLKEYEKNKGSLAASEMRKAITAIKVGLKRFFG